MVHRMVDTGTAVETQVEFKVIKADREAHVITAWAMISENTAGETVVDKQGHSITPRQLRKTFHDFIADSRRAGDNHAEDKDATVVSCMTFTKEIQEALGIPDGIVPVATLVEIRTRDEELFEKIASGQRTMLSIQGSGNVRES